MTAMTMTPEGFARQLEASLPKLSRDERIRMLRYARAWADVCYPEAVPEELKNKLKKLEASWRWT